MLEFGICLGQKGIMLELSDHFPAHASESIEEEIESKLEGRGNHPPLTPHQPVHVNMSQ